MGNIALTLLQTIASSSLKYFVIAAFIHIQGETTVLVSVYLIRNGKLDWPFFILSCAAGIIIYEIFFYTLGYYSRGTKFGEKIENIFPRLARAQYHLHEKSSFYLIISRFVVYFNVTSLFLAGWTRFPFKKFLKLRGIANLIWVGSIIIFSYFLVAGLTLLESVNVISHVEILILLFVLAIFIGKYFVQKLFIKGARIETMLTKIYKFLRSLGEENEPGDSGGRLEE
jgi:membrane protein DedA with SNARE-associated domain